MDTGESEGLIAQTARRLFASHCSSEQLKEAEDGWRGALWDACEEAGFPQAFEPASKDGFWLSVAEAMCVVRLAGEYAVPAPLAETMLARRLLRAAHIEPAAGPLTVAGLNPKDRLELTQTDGGWRAKGAAFRVPWARFAGHIVAVAETRSGTRVAAIPAAACKITPGENFAKEPRDTVEVDTVLPESSVAASATALAQTRAAGAALRVIQISGALDTILARTIAYAGMRVQFGRPIAKFQIIQQYVATIGGQVAAARVAANDCIAALEGDVALFAIAAAKTRVAEAATITAGLSHQVHGAIGFTQDYDLHHFTKRVWSWRDEFGSQSYWSQVLGEEICRRGGDDLWPFITAGLKAISKAD